MSVFSETISLLNRKSKTSAYYTYVEGIGRIPRDIHKYVKSDPLGDLPRYSIHIIIQHFLQFSMFLTLASTGLPLHFSEEIWAPYLISVFGGPDTARLIHRTAASLFIFSSVYHIFTIVIGTIQKLVNGTFSIRRTQVPILKDVFDLIHDIKYFLGIEPFRPKMEKFNYKQKMHYMAILWGNSVIITAGVTLLFPETISTVAPNPAFMQDLARLMHADEAILALTVLVFWHWSNVHLAPGRFPLQWTFLTGRITREHQIEEHFLEYLRNLEEIPEEREYIKKVLSENGFSNQGGV